MSAGISQTTGVITAINFVGTGTDKVFYENDQTVTQSYSISAGKNAMAAGPLAVASGQTITIPSGSELTIV